MTISRVRHLALPSALAALLLSVPALAQDAREPAPDALQYSFDDDKVLGDTVAPLGEVMAVRKRPPRESLVRAREGFVPELLRSVEAL